MRVLIFGPAAWEYGVGDVLVELSGGGPYTESQVREAIASQHRTLKRFVTSGRLAVNSRFADPDCGIQPTDEVALIALVSGG